MSVELGMAIALVALGTFCLRAVPMIMMRRHLARRERSGRLESLPVWMSVLGPAVIAALLGSALTPPVLDAAHAVSGGVGAAATLLVWRRTASLGWPLIAGVSAYGFSLLIYPAVFGA